jgi:beta-lactam-binding protein with PASTA domain
VVRIVVGATNTIQTVPVPDVTGMTEAVATQRLRADGFVVARATIPGAPNEAGLVRGTQPTARTPLARGAQVTLVVTEAPAPPAAPPLPNYVGMDISAAQGDLAARGMQVAVTYVSSLLEGARRAEPRRRARRRPRRAVTLTVSRAPTLGAR